jgi:signal transduction histidine kinase/ActR/RegA family two-component response regulator
LLGRRAIHEAGERGAAESNPSVRILIDPAEARAEKDRRARRLHVVTFPWIRLLGMQVLILIVLLHNGATRADLTFADQLWFIAAVESYALISWLLLYLLYGRVRADLGQWVLYADLVPFALTVYATGGPASWVYALLLVRVADQTSAGFRRMLLFAHIVPLVYLALVLWIGLVEGRPVAWPIELAKPVFLYAFALYLTTTARNAQAVRDRLAAAMRVARESIAALEDNQRTLQAQSRQLADAKRKAEDASVAKSAFLSRASHELRTPMNAVLGFAQLLDLEELPAGQREHVRQIVEGGVHLRALLDDLLDLTGIESGHLPLSLAPLPIAPALDEVAGMLRPAAEQARVALVLAPHCGERAVHADRRRLKQVLLNLISNGIKYNRPGGTVAIHCEAAGSDAWRIVVDDTGRGIPRAKLDRLYRPFDRLDAEQSGVEGTGLGLTLSRALVHAMGGEIGVDSEPGRGSRFWVELPRAAVTEEAVRTAWPRGTVAAPAGPARILYIEDHVANVALVERILARRPGTRLDVATNGAAGLALARRELPDLVLLDLNLPDMSGADVLADLRASPATSSLPVAIVSADALPERIDQMLAAGAQAYITKPFNVRSFLATIDRMLAEPAAVGHQS